MPRGRKPTPAATLKLRGTHRRNEHLHELTLPKSMPLMPAWMSGDAAELWEDIVPALYATGILASIDAQVLARYCRIHVRWLEADERNEARAIQLSSQLLRIEQEFGMTPSSRARVAIVKKDADPMDTFLDGDNDGQKNPKSKRKVG